MVQSWLHWDVQGSFVYLRCDNINSYEFEIKQGFEMRRQVTMNWQKGPRISPPFDIYVSKFLKLKENEL